MLEVLNQLQRVRRHAENEPVVEQREIQVVSEFHVRVRAAGAEQDDCPDAAVRHVAEEDAGIAGGLDHLVVDEEGRGDVVFLHLAYDGGGEGVEHVLELGAEAALVAEEGDIGEETRAEERLEEGKRVGVRREGGELEEDFAVGEEVAFFGFWRCCNCEMLLIIVIVGNLR